MGTPGTISIQKADKSIITTRVNWDAYPTGVGQELADNFLDDEEIEKIIKGGEIRHITDGLVEHYKNGHPVTTYSNHDEYMNNIDEKYNYIWKDSRWFLKTNNVLTSFELIDQIE